MECKDLVYNICKNKRIVLGVATFMVDFICTIYLRIPRSVKDRWIEPITAKYYTMLFGSLKCILNVLGVRVGV